MSNPPVKRQRADTAGTSHPSKVDCKPIILSLPSEDVAALLLNASKLHPEVADLIIRFSEKLKAAESAKVIDFDYLSKSAWKTINITYKHLSGSRQYNKSWEACEEVEDCIRMIRDKCPVHASFATKKNGLETLRKIGKSICLSGNSELGHRVQLHFQRASLLDETMMMIVDGLTLDERKRVWNNDGWNDKMIELAGLAKSYCCFRDLPDVLVALQGKSVSDESEESESEDETEDEEETSENDEEEEEDEDEDVEDEAKRRDREERQLLVMLNSYDENGSYIGR